MNSIISQCPDCCTCPTTTAEIQSRYATVTDEFDIIYSGTVSATIGGIYRTNTLSGGVLKTYDPSSGTWTSVDSVTVSVTGGEFSPCSGPWPGRFTSLYVCRSTGVGESDGYFSNPPISSIPCGMKYDYSPDGAYFATNTAHDVEDLAGYVDDRLAYMSWGAWTTSNPASYFYATELSESETGCSYWQVTKSETRYRFRFKIPKIGSGTCYRVSWVERIIPEAGVGLTSAEAIRAGVYRPTVTLSAPPAGGVQALAIAVMNSSGGVASIRLMNPGSGYTSAPTVTVQAATSGGTSSTGWTATLSGSQVSGINGGSAGNYLPTGTFSGGGGTGAAITFAMDSQGGVSVASITPGSGYAVAPSLTITAKVSGAVAALVHLHLGTETTRCTIWNGVTPGGYNPATSSTWPTLPSAGPGYFELLPPTAEGQTTIANVRAYCDCSTC